MEDKYNNAYTNITVPAVDNKLISNLNSTVWKYPHLHSHIFSETSFTEKTYYLDIKQYKPLFTSSLYGIDIN